MIGLPLGDTVSMNLAQQTRCTPLEKFVILQCYLTPASCPQRPLSSVPIVCVAGARKGRRRELGRETTREGGPRALARPNSPFPF